MYYVPIFNTFTSIDNLSGSAEISDQSSSGKTAGMDDKLNIIN